MQSSLNYHEWSLTFEKKLTSAFFSNFGFTCLCLDAKLKYLLLFKLVDYCKNALSYIFVSNPCRFRPSNTILLRFWHTFCVCQWGIRYILSLCQYILYPQCYILWLYHSAFIYCHFSSVLTFEWQIVLTLSLNCPYGVDVYIPRQYVRNL